MALTTTPECKRTVTTTFGSATFARYTTTLPYGRAGRAAPRALQASPPQPPRLEADPCRDHRTARALKVPAAAAVPCVVFEIRGKVRRPSPRSVLLRWAKPLSDDRIRVERTVLLAIAVPLTPTATAPATLADSPLEAPGYAERVPSRSRTRQNDAPANRVGRAESRVMLLPGVPLVVLGASTIERQEGPRDGVFDRRRTWRQYRHGPAPLAPWSTQAYFSRVERARRYECPISWGARLGRQALLRLEEARM